MDMIQKLNTLRASLEELCQMTDQMIEQCRASNIAIDTPQTAASDKILNFESVYPLCMEPGFFKGKSVVAVIFPDGVRRETPTWKNLVEVVMKRCNDDAGNIMPLWGFAIACKDEAGNCYEMGWQE